MVGQSSTLTTEAALTELGVTPDTLSESQIAHLDDKGYLVLPDHMPPGLLAELRERTDALLASERESAGHETPQSPGSIALANLINKGEVFERVFTDPSVLAAAWHILGDNLRVNSLNYRAAKPGEGHQALHADWGRPTPSGEYHLMNSMWVLDDFTDQNGATRAVPGSHRYERIPADDMPDPLADHPDQMLLTAKAGAVIIFNAHLWHGGTRNLTERPRRGMTMSYCRRDEAQQLDQRAYILPAVRERLSPAARYLLDV